MKTNDLGKEKISMLILRISLPSMAAQLVNALYNMVDRMFIGHIPDSGSLALTGLGICFPIITVISAFAALIGQGGAPIAAIYMGQGDNKTAEKLMGNCFTLHLLAGILLMGIVQIFGRNILFLVGASENTIAYAQNYLSVYNLGTIPVMLSLGMNNFINTQGFSRVGMMTVLAGALLNILLDPLFIYVFSMGVTGAAAATVISQIVSAIWVVGFLCGKKTVLRLKKETLKLKYSLVKRTLQLGLSPFVMLSTNSLVNFVLNSTLLALGGDMAVGAIAILSSVLQFATVTIQGFAQGGQPIISFNFGAGKYERVKEAFWLLLKYCLLLASVLWVVVLVMPERLVAIFTSDKQMLAYASPFLRLYLLMLLPFTVQVVCQRVFLATGQAGVSVFFALFRKVILMIPLALLFGRLIGAAGVFAAEPIADFLSATAAFIVFLYRRRLIFGTGEKKIQN